MPLYWVLNELMHLNMVFIAYKPRYTRGKPLVQISVHFMPSGTILKTVQRSPIYIFVKKTVVKSANFIPKVAILKIKCKNSPI